MVDVQTPMGVCPSVLRRKARRGRRGGDSGSIPRGPRGRPLSRGAGPGDGARDRVGGPEGWLMSPIRAPWKPGRPGGPATGCGRLASAGGGDGVDCEGDVADPGRRTAVKQRLRYDDQLVARFEEGDVGPIGAKLTARLAAVLTAAAECRQSPSRRAQCKRLPAVSRRLDRGMRPL